jgi:hypothetical protein
MSKLLHVICSTALFVKWFQSCLSSRSSSVRILGKSSSPCAMLSGPLVYTDRHERWRPSFWRFCVSTVTCSRSANQLESLYVRSGSWRIKYSVISSVEQTLACQSTMLPKRKNVLQKRAIYALEVCKELLARATSQFVFLSLSLRDTRLRSCRSLRQSGL